MANAEATTARRAAQYCPLPVCDKSFVCSRRRALFASVGVSPEFSDGFDEVHFQILLAVLEQAFAAGQASVLDCLPADALAAA